MPKLKRCPFCGGKVRISTVYIAYEEPEDCIICENCDALFMLNWASYDVDDLVERWSRRANDE